MSPEKKVGVGMQHGISTSSWPAGGVSPTWSSLFGVWRKVDGWLGSFRRGQLAGFGSCYLIMRAWDGYHLRISAYGNASDRHKGPSGRLWETESKVFKPDHVSLFFLHPLNLVVPSLQWFAIFIVSRTSSLENRDLVERKCLALLMNGEAFLLLVLFSWSIPGGQCNPPGVVRGMRPGVCPSGKVALGPDTRF